MQPPKELTWTTKNQKKIYVNEWKTAEGEDIKAVICLVHGLGEHIHRYDHVASYFNKKGYAWIGFDHIGHGKSDGKRGHSPSYQIFMDNISELLTLAEERYPLQPKFLYGHSMGGNLVWNYVLKNTPKIAGVISTGAAITLPNPPHPLVVSMAKMMNYILPSLHQPNGLDVQNISSDKNEVEKYQNDPLVHDRISIKMALDLINTSAWLEHFQGSVSIPALLMHGSEDQITGADGSEILANQLSGDVTLKIWENLFHEIHNEPSRAAVFDYTINWIEQKIQIWSDKVS